MKMLARSSIAPLDYFLDLCPFDLYSKTGPSIPSCNPAIAPDVSIIHGSSLTNSHSNTTTCIDSQNHHPIFNGELLLSYCPSTSLNLAPFNDPIKPAPQLVPCALTQCSSIQQSPQSILVLCQTINEHLDDIIRLLLHIDNGPDARMHATHILTRNIRTIVEQFISLQQSIIKPLNDSSSDMLKLNMLIRTSNTILTSHNSSFHLDHRLHEQFVISLKQFVTLIDSFRLSSNSLIHIDLQHILDTIHERTNSMHEHLITITRKLEANIV